MNVSVIIPAQDSEVSQLGQSLAGVRAQRYEAGLIEVIVACYGPGAPVGARGMVPSANGGRTVATDHPSPYAARNLAATQATGEVLLFTEPGCVPDADWVAEHVAALHESGATVSVGQVAPARTTRLVELFLSYESVRDAWVFSCERWQHYFGRPKNMAVVRSRFETHGPFVEVMRGADSKLVQRVAREVSCAEVTLARRAVVRQQSLRGLPSCYRDRFRHAKALRIHRSAHAAPIDFGQRVRIFRETVQGRRHGHLTSGVLIVLLAAGILAFRAGGWAGAVAARRHR